MNLFFKLSYVPYFPPEALLIYLQMNSLIKRVANFYPTISPPKSRTYTRHLNKQLIY